MHNDLADSTNMRRVGHQCRRNKFPCFSKKLTFLEFISQKLYKIFDKNSSGRDKGTLQHLNILIQRSNINGNVKSKFEVCIFLAIYRFIWFIRGLYILSNATKRDDFIQIYSWFPLFCSLKFFSKSSGFCLSW